MARKFRAHSERRIRDRQLLDVLEALDPAPYEGAVWRSVREGRDPLACWRSGGRWDDGTVDVLYASEAREAAIAERRFHLYQGQPLPPSKVRYELFELAVSLEAVMRFPDLEALSTTGLDTTVYGRLSYVERPMEYPRSQEIAEACEFLGADGLLVPSAREKQSHNLIVFCEQRTHVVIDIIRNHGAIDFSQESERRSRRTPEVHRPPHA